MAEAAWQESLRFAVELHSTLYGIPTTFGVVHKSNNFTEKERGELVGTYDKFVEMYFINEFARFETPNILVTSEEMAGAWPPVANEYWAIDPIDGTHDMAMNMPIYGIMGALVRDNKAVFSFVYLPNEAQLHNQCNGFYFAVRGHGSFIFDKRERPIKLSVSKQNDFDKSTIFVEGSIRYSKYPKFIAHIMSNHRTRNLGASCWSGTRVALGNSLPISVDALVISGVKPFDSLPIALLIEEAGGKVTDFNGQRYSPTNFTDLIMSNGILHEELLEVVV